MSGCDVEKKGRQRPVWIVIAMIFTGLVCSTAVVAAYDRFFAQKVVAVDLGGFISSQKDGYLAGRITAEELIGNIEGILRQIGARPKNEVLALDEAVAGKVKRLELKPAPDEEEE